MLRCFLLNSRHGPVLLDKETTHERVFQRHQRHLASCRRLDLSCVRVPVNQLVGATLYVTDTYVWRLFGSRRFCARDGNETLFAGSVENHGDAMDADLGGDALSG